MSDPKEETTILRRHLRAIEQHVDTMGASLKSERDRRKQIQPAAVAYQTMRKRTIDLLRFIKENPGSFIGRLEIEALLKGLPRTLDG